MQINQVAYVVTMDGGAEHRVEVDQRDFAAVEAQPFGDDASYTRGRFMVWNAMKRAQLYAGTFERFNSRDCVQVAIAGTEESDDPNRGRPEADAGR